MKSCIRLFALFIIVGLIGVATLAQQPPTQTGGNQTPPPQQPSSVEVRITGDPGTPPRMAVPDFLAISNDKETQAIARTIAEVLWNDLDFEREFYMIPRDTYRSIPPAASIAEPPFDRWRELGADGLVTGSVIRNGNTVRVEMRMYRVASRQQVYAREYSGTTTNPRLFAHTISDEIHESQRSLRGVARTKLAFSSDRNRESVAGTVENRDVKEVYISDYDGANQQRVTIDRQLSITPSWAPDGRAIAYTSYRRGYPDIYISMIFQGVMTTPTKGMGHNYLPVFSPDGTQIAFASSRDGNPEVYVMNRDGSGIRRITNHPGIDWTPTWAPSGTQIAFVSERAGVPSIWVVGVDGLNPRRVSFDLSDRPTWSPAPYNEIAYAARTGPGYDIKILNLAAGETRQITFGEGTNESPAWAPNGRHLAFSSTRAGRVQIFTVDRDGRNVRQITRDGNNQQPHWSQ
jgi:TolB protein